MGRSIEQGTRKGGANLLYLSVKYYIITSVIKLTLCLILCFKIQSFMEEHSTVVPIEDIWSYHRDTQEHGNQGSFHLSISFPLFFFLTSLDLICSY